MLDFSKFSISKFWFSKSKSVFSKTQKLNFSKKISETYPTLKSYNFFDIGSILKILNVSESFGSLLSHWCTYFPDPLRETTSKVANPMPVRLGAARRAVGLDQISKDFELEPTRILPKPLRYLEN